MCQDVDPVPVDTHKPELLVLVIVLEVLGRKCKCETLADNVSPMKTYVYQNKQNV